MTLEFEPAGKYAVVFKGIRENMSPAHSPALPAYPGLYADNPNWRDLHVWEPEFARVPRVEARCMARVGSIHCSLPAGHGGQHCRENMGLYWSDGTATADDHYGQK